MAAEIIRVGPLAKLGEDEMKALADCSRQRTFKVDEIIIEQGQLNGSLFVVTEGLLHVRRRAEGRHVLLGRMEPGAFFGDISIFDPGPTTADVVGVTAGRLVEVAADNLDQFMALHPGAAARLLRALLEEVAQRLRRTDERLVEAIFWGGLLR
jgi:CRP/FNR family transcriptional regulator, cyclic AMP receptor protein